VLLLCEISKHISQRWVDPFQGDVCTPPVTYFHHFYVLYVCATYQPRGPHLTDVKCLHTSPRCSTLHNFSDQGATPSPSETSIHDVARHQIPQLSFLLDRWFKSNRDLVTRGFKEKRTLPPISRYLNSRNGSTVKIYPPCALSSCCLDIDSMTQILPLQLI
jgi:hypothetical protein